MMQKEKCIPRSLVQTLSLSCMSASWLLSLLSEADFLHRAASSTTQLQSLTPENKSDSFSLVLSSKCLRKFSGWPSLGNISTPQAHILPRKMVSPEGKAKNRPSPPRLEHNPPFVTSFPPPDLPGCLIHQGSFSSFRAYFMFILLTHPLKILSALRLTLFTPLPFHRHLCFQDPS